ncbi:MAG: malate permease, partial [Enterococcus faecalis]
MEKKLHATAANETDWRNKLTKTRIGSVTLPVYLVTASIILVTALLE